MTTLTFDLTFNFHPITDTNLILACID